MKYALLYDDVENGGRAVWDESRETWKIPPLKLQGGGDIIESIMTMQSHHRPETEFARRRKVSDANPRWRSEDIVDLDIAMPTRSTPDQGDPNTLKKIRDILVMDLNEPIRKTSSSSGSIRKSSSAKRRESKYLSVSDNAGKAKSKSANETSKQDEHNHAKSFRRNTVF